MAVTGTHPRDDTGTGDTLPPATATLGPLGTCFRRNLQYLQQSFFSPNYVDPTIPDNARFWYTTWPTANEGRLLAGAGHSLRFLDIAVDGSTVRTLNQIISTLVGTAATRQWTSGPNRGYCLVYSMYMIQPQGAPGKDAERPNYDRAMWTRGMIAAILAGDVQPSAASNADTAKALLRNFYDWFNAAHDDGSLRSWGSADLAYLLKDKLGVQGHVGSTLVARSAIGTPADLITGEKYYVQHWLLDKLRWKQPLAISSYPLDRPHSYLLIALEAYLDHYLATGQQEYLDAVNGGWAMFRRDFTFNGDGTSITEHVPVVPAGTQNLDIANNEGCGTVFWIDLNHRLHQLTPSDERFVAEIERGLFNVCLAQQSDTAPYGIRYHALYEGGKEAPSMWNTCDEITECGLYGRLPQYIYSLDVQGIFYINLYESSTARYQVSGVSVSVATTASFPAGNHVEHAVRLAGPPSAVGIAIRVPNWATGSMVVTCRVPGQTDQKAVGQPGSYVIVAALGGCVISYDLPIGFTLSRYTGMSQITGYSRYSLHYGPVLMAVTGSWTGTYRQAMGGQWIPRIKTDPNTLISQLTPVPNQPLHFTAPGGLVYKPYYQIQAEALSCFPIIAP